VISVFASRARSGQELCIFGDGEQTRDFVFVADVVRAVLDAGLSECGDGAVLNIGTGRETSVKELAAKIAGLCANQGGPPVAIRFAEPRPGEIRRSGADVERAREVLGFDATTPLSDGLRATLEALH
jgi:UDP-glucose 4-epimerase